VAGEIAHPLKYTDLDDRTAEYEIDEANKTVNINIKTTVYGDGANEAIIQEYKNGIENAWGQDSSGNPWQMEINGESYSVNFQVAVNIGKKPGIFKLLWNFLFGTENFVNADNSNTRSEVRYGFSGTWRTAGRNNLSLSADNPAGHETGHLLGFKDRYDPDTFVPKPNYAGNIMAEPAMMGNVEQRNIDSLGGFINRKGRATGVIRNWSMKY
jgi:hypothetical protein